MPKSSGQAAAVTVQPAADGDPGRGRRIAFDVGSVRIGVALSDPDGILATPLETIVAAVDGSDIERAKAIIVEYECVEIIVGLPLALRGNHTASTQAAIVFAEDLALLLAESAFADAIGEGVANGNADDLPTEEILAHSPIPIRLVDERMSTVAATAAMRSSGVNTKKGRKQIDQAAAVHILQGWLDARTAIIRG